MTLLTSLLTRDYVVSLADRRLTLPDGTLFDDTSNKAVQFGPMFAFTYTGLAQIQGARTDAWLATTLSKLTLSPDPLGELCSEADRAISTLRIPGERKRQAFLAVGWALVNDQQQASPVAIGISNALDADMRWLSDIRPFATQTLALPDGMWWRLPRPLGVPVSDAEYKALGRLVRRCRRHRISALGMAHVLARFTRTVAMRDPRVGKDLVAVVVPPPSKEDLRSTYFAFPLQGGAPDLSHPVCLLMTESERTFKWTLPAYVSHGVAFTDTLFEPNDDGWEITAKVCGRPLSGTVGLSVRAGDEFISLLVGPDGPPFVESRTAARPRSE